MASLSSDEDSDLERRFFRCMESEDEEEEEEETKEEEEEEEDILHPPPKDAPRWMWIAMLRRLQKKGFDFRLNLEEATLDELKLEYYRMLVQKEDEVYEKNKAVFLEMLGDVVHAFKKQLKILPGKGLLPDAILPPSDLVKLARRNRFEETAERARVHQEVDTLGRAYFKKIKKHHGW